MPPSIIFLLAYGAAPLSIALTYLYYTDEEWHSAIDTFFNDTVPHTFQLYRNGQILEILEAYGSIIPNSASGGGGGGGGPTYINYDDSGSLSSVLLRI